MPTEFKAATYLREIGRGKEGARGLSRSQAHALFTGILTGQVGELELGGILIALRVKGESTDELLGFLDALVEQWPSSIQLDAQIAALNAHSQDSGKPVIVIPTYNGARRKPNFTPLLAGLLAQRGYPVLCHGVSAGQIDRVTTQEVFDCLSASAGWPMSPAPVFEPIVSLYPALHQLLEKRTLLGVRNVAHTLTKLLVPAGLNRSVLVTAYTHPEFQRLQTEVLSQWGQTALVIRGHEGEAVAAPYRAPQMDGVKAGAHWLISEQESHFREKPDPRPDVSAQATAELILKWLNEPGLLPHGFLKQLDAIDTLAHHAV